MKTHPAAWVTTTVGLACPSLGGAKLLRSPVKNIVELRLLFIVLFLQDKMFSNTWLEQLAYCIYLDNHFFFMDVFLFQPTTEHPKN